MSNHQSVSDIWCCESDSLLKLPATAGKFLKAVVVCLTGDAKRPPSCGSLSSEEQQLKCGGEGGTARSSSKKRDPQSPSE